MINRKQRLNRSESIKNSFKKNSKGITLMTLIIYITIIFVILVLTMRVMKYYTGNIRDAADTSFETEFEKFNVYMLQETRQAGNGFFNAKTNKLSFANGDVIEFRKEEGNDIGEIYHNDIKICENVDACTLTSDNSMNGETTVTVNITINGISKNDIQYVMPTYTGKMPFVYQEVEYIESTGTQYIDTNVSMTLNTTILSKFNLTNSSGNTNWSAPYGCTPGLGLYMPSSRITEKLTHLLEVIQM